MQHNITRKVTIVIILIVLSGALVLRVYNLYRYDLWFDELCSDAYSARYLRQAADWHGTSVFSLFLDKLKHDTHSSFYYLLVYLYSFLTGAGKSLRGLSVVFSMLSLGMLYRFSRLFFSRRISIYALLIMALSPFHLWYAQEARAYAMSCFFALLMLYLYVQALKTGRLLYWICFPFCGVFAVYSSYYSALLLIASAVILLFKDYRQYIKRWLLCILAILLSFLPLLSVFIKQLSFVKWGFWLSEPTLKSIPFTFAIFMLGYSANVVQYYICLIAIPILFIYGVYSYRQTDRENTILLLSLFLLPITAIYIFSKMIMPVYIDRQLIIFTPFYYLFVAKGIGSVRSKRLQTSLGVLVAALLIASALNYYRGFMISYVEEGSIFVGVELKKNYSDLTKYMRKEFKAGDIMAATDIQSYNIVSAHIRQESLHYQQPMEILKLFFYPLALDKYTKSYLRIEGSIEEIPAGDKKKIHVLSWQDGKQEIKKVRLLDEYRSKRIWLVSSSWNKKGPISFNGTLVRRSMRRNFKRALSMGRDGIFLELYTATAR